MLATPAAGAWASLKALLLLLPLLCLGWTDLNEHHQLMQVAGAAANACNMSEDQAALPWQEARLTVLTAAAAATL